MEFRDLKKQYEVLKPEIDKAVQDVINSSRFISGPQVKELENALAEYVGVKHCISCANGTDAITLGMMAWGIGKGDAVFVPDFTFFASGECPAAVGATPVFVDVSEDTYNLDPDKLEEAVKKVLADGKYTPKAVVAVDLYGQCADYDRIIPICRKYDLLLLEDGAQGFGSSIRGKMACSFGDISTTSFFPAKPLGCYGDGGAVFTDNDQWAELIRSYAVHGKGTMKYDNVRIGMNSRLDTIQAAILQVKFEALKKHELDEVNAAADYYNELLKDSKVKTPVILPGHRSSYAQYTIQLPEGTDRDQLQRNLKEKGIPTNVYYPIPMHCQHAFDNTYSAQTDAPVTDKLCESVLSLPMGPYLAKEDMTVVVKALADLL